MTDSYTHPANDPISTLFFEESTGNGIWKLIVITEMKTTKTGLTVGVIFDI